MSKQDFMLPDKTCTKSTKEYVEAWRGLAAPICKLMGWSVYGYDPDITLCRPTGQLVELPADLLLKLNEVLEK